MKTIKWLWSIAFAFMIVLFGATMTSLFVTQNSPWYIGLIKNNSIPTPPILSIGWGIIYVLLIIIITTLIYNHNNSFALIAIISIGILQILWSIIFFDAHSLIGGLIIELIILFLSILTLQSLKCENAIVQLLMIIVLFWYIYVTICGYNIWLLNY